MQRLKRWMTARARTLVALSGLVLSIISYFFRLSIPKTKGVMLAEGLDGEILIVRDEWGIPRISAQTRRDAFFACGVVHAQDRLWQLELHRRTASGTLSEIVGERALPADRFMRRVGLRRTAEEQLSLLPAHIRTDIEAYAQGINYIIRKTPKWRLPVEFILLRYQPKLWEPVDTLSFVKLIGFGFSPNWDTQIVRSWLIERLGPEKAAALEPKYVAPQLLMQRPGTRHDEQDMTLLSEFAEVASWLPTASGSNAWAVDGTKSASGKPLLANDTHTPAHFPALWYEMGLRGGDLNVSGVSIPGFPGVIAGHNKDIAWGISSGLVNQQDIFVEQLNPLNPLEYMYNGQWRQGDLVTEHIVVRGKKEPVTEEILVTHHGPIISPLIPGAKRALALKSVPRESWEIVQAASGVMVAKNWEEFRHALAQWSSPPMNFVYVDKEGHIGWQLAGFIPMRGQRSGLVPGRGWTSQDEWQEYIPFEAHPSVFDPESHIVAAANNRPSDQFLLFFSGEWADSFRIRRITDILNSKKILTLGDFQEMQGDVSSDSARELLEFVLNFNSDDPKVSWMLQQLRTWDCRIEKTSVPAAIFEVFGFRLYYNIFAEKLGNDIDLYMGKGIHVAAHINALGYRAASNLMRILRSLPADWFSSQHGGHQKTLDDVMAQSFKEAYAFLRTTLGRNKKRWQWGKIHTVTFPHAFGKVPLLGGALNQGPYPISGDMNTIPQASYDPSRPFSCNAAIVSWRHISDCSNFDLTRTVMPPGQSGHPRSRNSKDQIGPWLDIQYHGLAWNPEAGRTHTKDTLKLKPKT